MTDRPTLTPEAFAELAETPRSAAVYLLGKIGDDGSSSFPPETYPLVLAMIYIGDQLASVRDGMPTTGYIGDMLDGVSTAVHRVADRIEGPR